MAAASSSLEGNASPRAVSRSRSARRDSLRFARPANLRKVVAM
jgi:hypothetical protein